LIEIVGEVSSANGSRCPAGASSVEIAPMHAASSRNAKGVAMGLGAARAAGVHSARCVVLARPWSGASCFRYRIEL